jgi:hypothetical protein
MNAVFVALRYVLSQFSQEVQWVKDFPVVLRAVEDLALFGKIGELVEGDGCSDEISGEMLPPLLFVGLYPFPDMNVEAAMTPGEEPLDGELRYAAFLDEHREDLLLEEALRLFCVYLPGKEHEVPVGEEASVGHEGMSVGVEVDKISGRMDCYDRPAYSAILLYSGQVELMDGLIRAGA